MRSIRSVVMVSLIMAMLPIVSLAASAADVWLPLTKTQIISQTVGSASIENLKVELVDAETLAKKTRSLEANESVWVALNSALAMVMVLAGKGENIHSIRVPVITLAERENLEGVFRLLSGLFKSIYPDWPEAQDWPKASLEAAWNMSPLVKKTMPTDPNDQIVKKRLHGITSATFGVPPDIVVYTITTRGACVPDVKQGNPFDRLIC